MAEIPLRPGELVAVVLGPGDIWRELIAYAWSRRAAIMPVHHRLPPSAVQSLLERAKPRAIFDGTWWPRDGARLLDPDIGIVMATSGTEGEPKLAALSREALDAATRTSNRRLGATPQDSWLACLPFAHIGGLLTLLRSTQVTIQWPFDPDLLSQSDETFVSLVPTMLHRALDQGVDLKHFKAVLVGGAHCPPSLRERAEAGGATIVETYGLTESCGGVIYDGMPLDGTQFRLQQDGRILVHGPTLMRGYLHEQQQPFNDDGWLITGDAGTLDEEGRLAHVERADDVIVTGGENVHPTVVEDVLKEHPAVDDVVVVGRPDPEWGQRVVAVIVPRDTMPSLEVIRAFVKERLPAAAAPTLLYRADAIPRTRSGKPRRALLRG